MSVRAPRGTGGNPVNPPAPPIAPITRRPSKPRSGFPHSSGAKPKRLDQQPMAIEPKRPDEQPNARNLMTVTKSEGKTKRTIVYDLPEVFTVTEHPPLNFVESKTVRMCRPVRRNRSRLQSGSVEFREVPADKVGSMLEEGWMYAPSVGGPLRK